MQNDEVLDWKKIFDINLLGLTCMMQEVLKLMKKKGKISFLIYKNLENYYILCISKYKFFIFLYYCIF